MYFCNQINTLKDMEDSKRKIGLVMKSLRADFFKDMQAGAEKFVKDTDCCQLISVGTENQTEIDRQIELVDQLTADGVDAIVVVPIDSKALVAPVVRAVDKGVTVVNIDIKLDDALLGQAGIDVDFVGPDNFSAAYRVARLLADALAPGDKVAMIEGLRVADNAQQRKASFDKAIAERGLNCVASETANWETHEAERVMADIIARHPDIKAVFCCNDAMALGAINVMKEKGLNPGDIKVVGFDNDEVMRPLLAEGWLLGTIDAFGQRMAVEGIRHALVLLADGKSSAGSKAMDYEVISYSEQ